jgi:hypothetical protein
MKNNKKMKNNIKVIAIIIAMASASHTALYVVITASIADVLAFAFIPTFTPWYFWGQLSVLRKMPHGADGQKTNKPIHGW